MVGDVVGGEVVVGAHRLGGRQVAAAGEHRQPLEDALLVVEEQLVAPVDDGPQRLLAGQGGARPAGQQAEPVVEPGGDLLRSGTLGCGRRPARWRAAARRAGRRCRRWRRARSSASSSGAPAAWARATNSCDGVVGGQRRHRPDGLAADPQPLAARGQEPQARAATQQVLGHLGGGGDDVLAVVEHDQQLPVADHLGEPGRVRQVEGGGDRRGTPAGSPTGASSTRHPPKRRPSASAAADLEGQPGLAHPAGADEGDEAMLGEQRREVAQLRVAADQRRQRLRDAPGERGAGGGRGDGRRRGASSDGSWARIAASSRRSSGPGSRPSSSPRSCRPSWKTRRASACRPARYSASISSPRSRSRSGWAATSSSSWTIGALVAARAGARGRAAPRATASRSSRQPGDRRRREVLVGEVGERIAPPERVGLGQQVDGPVEVTGGGQRPPLGDQLLEPVRRRWRRRAARGRSRRRASTTRSAEPSARRSFDASPCRPLRTAGRRVVAPQRVDELLGRAPPGRRAAPARRGARAASRPRPRRRCPSSSSTSSSPSSPMRMGRRYPGHRRTFSARSARRQPSRQPPAGACADASMDIRHDAIEHALLAVMAARRRRPRHRPRPHRPGAAAAAHDRAPRAPGRRDRRAGRRGPPGARRRTGPRAHVEFPDDAELLGQLLDSPDRP